MILRFQNFINEKLGVALPSLRYNNMLYEIIELKLREYIESNSDKKSDEFLIKRDELSPLFGEIEEYILFPVNEIKLKLEFKKIKGLFKKRKIQFFAGGSAYQFGHRNWKNYSKVLKLDDNTSGLNLLLGISIEIDSNWKDAISNDGTINNELKDDIISTLWHEMNHFYEGYNRLLNMTGALSKRTTPLSLSFLDKNTWRTKAEIYKYWNRNFLYLIYRSEKSEINANVQEFAYRVTKYGFNSAMDSEIWKMSNRLKEFNKEEFITNLENEVKKHYNEDTIEFIKNRLKRMTIKVYRENLKVFKEESTMDIEKLEKMSFDDFVGSFEKRINEAGNTLKRKIIKLKSIEDEEIY